MLKLGKHHYLNSDDIQRTREKFEDTNGVYYIPVMYLNSDDI